LETNFRHHYEKLNQLEAEFQKELKEDSSKDWRGDEPGYKELTAKINLLRKNIEEQEKVTLRAEEEIYKNTLRVRSLAQK
jgi:ATP/maltotriose-dependent transcriptional regulator MalT